MSTDPNNPETVTNIADLTDKQLLTMLSRCVSRLKHTIEHHPLMCIAVELSWRLGDRERLRQKYEPNLHPQEGPNGQHPAPDSEDTLPALTPHPGR